MLGNSCKLLKTLTKHTKNPKNPFLTLKRPLYPTQSLLLPSLLTHYPSSHFSTTSFHQSFRYYSAQAAVTQLETSFIDNLQSASEQSQMTFDSIFEAMSSMKEKEFTFEEFKEVYPLADELAYLLVTEIEEKGGVDKFVGMI